MKETQFASERGQVLVLMALATFTVLLSAAALTVDLGNGHLQKRKLQTIADSAALAGAQAVLQHQDPIAAATSILNNSGIDSSMYGVNPPVSNVGSGTGLALGIQYDEDDGVRVALRRDVGTFFGGVVGVNEMGVTAKSHAKVSTMGVLPVAVKRFSEGDTRYALGTHGNPSTVQDFMAPAASDTIASWPSPLDIPPSTAAGYSDPDHYDPMVSGRVLEFVGQNANPNVAQSANFHFWVGADIRDITNPSGATFLGGLNSSSSLQTMKDVESAYFAQKGYTGPFVEVGDQVAAMLGVDWSLTVEQIRKVFKRGDVVTAMVYDGTVYRKPSFSLSLTPDPRTAANVNRNQSDSNYAPFKLTLTPENGFASPIDGVQISAMGLKKNDGYNWASWYLSPSTVDPASNPSSYGPPPYDSAESVQPTWNEGHTYLVNGGGPMSIPFYVVSDSSTNTEGARTVQIRARDLGGKVVQMASASVVAGGLPRTQTYSIYSPQAYKIVKQGDGVVTFDVKAVAYNGYDNNPGVEILGYEWYRASTDMDNPEPVPAGLIPVSAANVTMPARVRVEAGNPNNRNKFAVSVNVDGSAVPGEWMMKVKLTDRTKVYNDPAADDVQYVYLTLQINLPDAATQVADTTDFVYVLGYANFVLTYAGNGPTPAPPDDQNTIYAYAVSPIESRPDLLSLGMKPRLVGWNQ